VTNSLILIFMKERLVHDGVDQRLCVMLTPSYDGEFYISFMISLCHH
jgi:hypothetical protein